MRILHILDHSLPMHSGYTFRTRAILTAQQAKGWAVAGVTGLRHSAAGPTVETVYDLTFHRTPNRKTLPSPISEWQETSALADQICKVAQDFKPDILHAHSPALNGLAAARAARRLGLPLLYEIRAFWEDAAVGNGTGTEGSMRYRATRALETYVVRRANAIAVICEGLKNDLVARGIPDSKIMTSPNGVDLGLFGEPTPRDESLAAELGVQNADMVGFIGSFYDYEGLDDLVAAMPGLIAVRPAAHLLLVGGGPVEGALKAQAEALGLLDRIHFTGRVPHHEVQRYYSLIDVLAYPRKKMRLTELVTPLKPLEAMAQMKLVAASDVGGHRELIEDGVTGTLFAPDDPAAIASALSALFADRSNWDERRKTARAFVERERNWAMNIARYDPVYHKLTKSGVTPALSSGDLVKGA